MELLPTLIYSILPALLVSGANIGTPLESSTRTENAKVDRSLKTSGNLLQSYTGVDPSSCHCLPATQQCKVSLAKSSLLEVSCPKNHNYCCDDSHMGIPPAVVDADKPLDSLVESDSEPQRPQARIRIRIPSEEMPMTQSSPEKLDQNQNPFDSTRLVKPQMSCSCKARDNCEDKYTDYTFGFHCSYDKVRCCEPQNLIEKEMSNGGRLITVGKNEQMPSPTAGTNYECQCVSLQQCIRLNLNVVRSGKDDLCPFRFVKCCGVSITKKSDTGIVEEDLNVSLEGDELETGRGMMGGIDMHGQPAFRQPIQLPVSKIPIDDSAKDIGENIDESDSIHSGGQAEVIQSPPELPHSYHEVADPGHSGIPSNFYQQGVQRPPIHQYFGGVNVGPGHAQQNPAPVPYRTINVNGPVGVGGRYGRPEPPSFLEAVSNFFFG